MDIIGSCRPLARGFAVTRRTFIVGAMVGCSKDQPNIYRLSTGERFGMIGGIEGTPKPSAFRFLGLLENALAPDKEPNYGELLVKRGYVLVSLDPPCHGEDRRKDEPPGLGGWRHRIDRGEAIMPPFVKRCRAVIDHLLERNIATTKIAATGVSRGAFCALHLAAADKRIQAVVGVSAVTDLSFLREFKGYDSGPEPIPVEDIPPTLIMMHENDERVGTEPARHLVSRLKETGTNATLDIVPGSGHGIRGRQDFVADWLHQSLRSSARSLG